MTANMAVSSSFPSLPRRAVMASFSSSVRPRVRWRGSATPAVSSTPPTLPGPTGAPEDAKSGGKPAHLQVLTRPPACNNGSMTVVENEATESRTPHVPGAQRGAGRWPGAEPGRQALFGGSGRQPAPPGPQEDQGVDSEAV